MKRLQTLIACAALVASGSALAQRHGDGDAPHQHVDARHGLNHPYPDHGGELRSLPRSALVLPRGDERYWFHDGTWYRHDGPRYVVVGPPLGVIVPVLPSLYVTLNLGGIVYYYANDTYYAYNAEAGGYEVVAAPDGAEAAPASAPTSPSPAPAANSQYIYPQRGQSPEQQATDRYECHRWAADQSGFDPTLTSGGVAPELADAKRAEYARAMAACLEGRGYSVR